ncbi:MAG TPA: hypothetical protein VEU96_10000 [Bryobacteraceae bacterium]|nr:hypothetical protein [Bryobacteraceae bacterium]
MQKALLDVPIASHRETRFVGFAPGQEKFAFLYVVVSALVIPCAMTFSAIAGLAWWQTALLLIGLLVGAWGTLFSLLEVSRIGRTAMGSAGEAPGEDANPYFPRTVVVEPPTNDPYPHHEYYAESQGFDQGQLTSRLPDATPIIESFLRRRREKKAATR